MANFYQMKNCVVWMAQLPERLISTPKITRLNPAMSLFLQIISQKVPVSL
jgi:hypothetical protein